MITIGIDPHKGSHTAVAVDEHEQVLDQVRVSANRRQVDQLLAWAQRWPQRRWGVGGANGLGHLVAQRLVGAGQDVVDVPARLAARVRVLDEERTRKNDPNDARSTAIAALRHRRLRPVVAEDHTVVLRMLATRRAQLQAGRIQAVCRVHAVIRDLRAGGAGRRGPTAKAASLLAGMRPDGAVELERKERARELLDDLRRFDRLLVDNERKTTAAVRASGTTLTEVLGVGPVLAGLIIGHTGEVARFAGRANYASHNGTAPIEASSGDIRRHRLSRRHNRQLNYALHMIAVTQMTHRGPGQAYYQRKLAEGKTEGEARRALKRQISNVVFSHLAQDAQRAATAAKG
jgi:hypothetical protein